MLQKTGYQTIFRGHASAWGVRGFRASGTFGAVALTNKYDA
jgi:hypothetical protein